MVKKNPFTDNLYGTYEGPRGNANQWRKAFTERLSDEEIEEILQDDSPWSILGIPTDSSEEDIKRAYRKLSMEFHPDRHAENKEMWSEKFLKIKAAYDSLLK